MRLRAIAIVATIAASALIASPVSAHTGGIQNTQSCDTGTTITAVLDANVADSSTWVVRVNGVQRAHGTGPGPADLGPFHSGPAAGSASLTIDFEGEHHVYFTAWPRITGCNPPDVVRPRAWFAGPCGDPMHAAVLDNRASTVPVTFRWYRIDGGVSRIVKRTVAAGAKVRTAWRHVDGGTRMLVIARQRVIAVGTAAPAGNYRACR